jgi:hypothetical protein
MGEQSPRGQTVYWRCGRVGPDDISGYSGRLFTTGSDITLVFGAQRTTYAGMVQSCRVDEHERGNVQSTS